MHSIRTCEPSILSAHCVGLEAEIGFTDLLLGGSPPWALPGPYQLATPPELVGASKRSL